MAYIILFFFQSQPDKARLSQKTSRHSQPHKPISFHSSLKHTSRNSNTYIMYHDTFRITNFEMLTTFLHHWNIARQFYLQNGANKTQKTGTLVWNLSTVKKKSLKLFCINYEFRTWTSKTSRHDLMEIYFHDVSSFMTISQRINFVRRQEIYWGYSIIHLKSANTTATIFSLHGKETDYYNMCT